MKDAVRRWRRRTVRRLMRHRDRLRFAIKKRAFRLVRRWHIFWFNWAFARHMQSRTWLIRHNQSLPHYRNNQALGVKIVERGRYDRW